MHVKGETRDRVCDHVGRDELTETIVPQPATTKRQQDSLSQFEALVWRKCSSLGRIALFTPSIIPVLAGQTKWPGATKLGNRVARDPFLKAPQLFSASDYLSLFFGGCPIKMVFPKKGFPLAVRVQAPPGSGSRAPGAGLGLHCPVLRPKSHGWQLCLQPAPRAPPSHPLHSPCL